MVTCTEFERAFKECENKDYVLKIGLVYFAKAIMIRAKSNVAVNLDYFHLIEDMDRFNDYSWWGAISFEQLQDYLICCF